MNPNFRSCVQPCDRFAMSGADTTRPRCEQRRIKKLACGARHPKHTLAVIVVCSRVGNPDRGRLSGGFNHSRRLVELAWGAHRVGIADTDMLSERLRAFSQASSFLVESLTLYYVGSMWARQARSGRAR